MGAPFAQAGGRSRFAGFRVSRFERWRAPWQALASEAQAVAGGVGLHHPEVAFLLANGVWAPAAERLPEAAAWCEARRLPAALLLDAADAALRAAARSAGFRLAAAFEEAPLPEPATGSGAAGTSRSGADPPRWWVEQAGWAHTHDAGLLLARRYRQPDFALPIAAALTAAMQRQPRFTLYLGFAEAATATESSAGAAAGRSGGPVGERASAALLAWRGDHEFVALLQAGEPAPLLARLAADAAAERLTPRRWLPRGAHGRPPARGLLRLERPEPVH